MGRRGFSLIELLVVIAVIMVLAGIVLPGVLGSRRTAQRTVGASNLRSASLVLLARAIDRKSMFFNPFIEQQAILYTVRTTSGDPGEWMFPFKEHNRYATEGFMAYWYDFLLQSEPGTTTREAIMSPADAEIARAVRGVGGGNVLVPSSFYYPPVFWKSRAEFWFDETIPPECGGFGNLYRRDACPPCGCPAAANSLDDVAYPSLKVLLFERADFMQPSRVTIRDGQSKAVPLPPAWNNPRAKPQVAVLDGSVATANMQELTDLASRAITSNPPDYTYLPVDFLAAPDTLPIVPSGGAAIIDACVVGDGLYPYFFGTTRYGLRGRDLVR